MGNSYTSHEIGIDKSYVDKLEPKSNFALQGSTKTLLHIGNNSICSILFNPASMDIDTFKDTGNGTYSGKLKATYRTGPKITEEDVMNKVKGKGLGEVQTMIKSIKGVKEVKVKSSYFWVVSVPEDPNKISIELISADE